MTFVVSRDRLLDILQVRPDLPLQFLQPEKFCKLYGNSSCKAQFPAKLLEALALVFLLGIWAMVVEKRVARGIYV